MASATSLACVASFILLSAQGEPAVPLKEMECAAMPCRSASLGSHLSAQHQPPWNVPCMQTRCFFGLGGAQVNHCMRWPDFNETCVVSTLSAAAAVAAARAASRCMVAVRAPLKCFLEARRGSLALPLAQRCSNTNVCVQSRLAKAELQNLVCLFTSILPRMAQSCYDEDKRGSPLSDRKKALASFLATSPGWFHAARHPQKL